MVDLGPNKKRIAQFFRLLGSSNDGERRAAYAKLVAAMRKAGIDWTDMGDIIEGSGDGKFSEEEMLEAVRAARAEGVEDGARIGAARANGNAGGGGGLSLPSPKEMARYCHDRLGHLKDANQREFIGDVFLLTQRRTLSRGQLGYLASIYIQAGGKT
ncbi:hypothetical protein JQ595_16515 [Bradyrhizobium japonicum]|uniref:hypothetical protein n=1 Tax=Bradyrhizobium japonicum TaxID=375 RepID=UPI001BA96884|nr:hypothetical protein [Bradyrhizobium japonicum]MBR0730356.1 hypothetical protein [Bradyrhizobium japonicum]